METTDIKKLSEYAISEENSRIRADMWSDFVGWDNRRRGENGFLINKLKEHDCKKVLDIALGDGVDTIFLLQQGFEVSSNEVDSAFRQKAIENAKKDGLSIKPTSADWRELGDVYPENSFDAVICMGNSLTCLFGEENRLEALEQIRKVLKPGGMLIVDERNFQRILDNREDALAGTLHSTGKFLYTGTSKVKASFVEVNDNFVLVEYHHIETDKKAYYKAYPFKRGELQGLLQEAGFTKLQTFSDYSPNQNTDADFYEYVCVK